MTNQEVSLRNANRRAALGIAAKYLSDNDIVFPDYAAWAWGPTKRGALCPAHGGPDPLVCESCEQPFADDAEIFDCPNANGPLHVACHARRDCRNRDCIEALNGPWEE